MSTLMPPAPQDEEVERQLAEADALRGIGRAKAIQPNALMQIASLAARGGRELGNLPGKLPEKVPLVGGQGLGDLLFGKSPEALDDWSYGIKKPIDIGSGKNLQTMNIDPRIIDVAGSPLVGVGAGLKGAQLGKQAIMSKLLQEGIDLGRREFLKQGAAVAGAGAASAATPSLIKQVMKGLPEEVAPTVARGAAATGARSVYETLPWLRKLFKDIEPNKMEYWDSFLEDEIAMMAQRGGQEAKDAKYLQGLMDSGVDRKSVLEEIRHRAGFKWEEGLAEDAIREFGPDVAPEYMRGMANPMYDTGVHNLPKTPGYKLKEPNRQGDHQAWLDMVNAPAYKKALKELEDYHIKVGDAAYRRMIGTGRLPPDFPKGPYTYDELLDRIR